MNMKICSKCETEKPYSEFYKNKRRSDGHQDACKMCADIMTEASRKKKRKHYQAMREKYRVGCLTRFQNWKRERGCKYCPETEPVCLDLHHLDPSEKDFNPSSRVGYKWETLMEEAVKCIIVCKNCHAKIHNDIALPV